MTRRDAITAVVLIAATRASASTAKSDWNPWLRIEIPDAPPDTGPDFEPCPGHPEKACLGSAVNKPYNCAIEVCHTDEKGKRRVARISTAEIMDALGAIEE